MKSKTKVKAVIVLIALLAILLLGLIGYQLIQIHKAKRTIAKQQQQIETFQEELDYYKNKLPDTEFETITGETN